MKKSFTKKLLIFAIILFSPLITEATSGACSHHQGVNCGAGASLYGKVQCNDGWINSLVYFSDAEECKVQCSYPDLSYCSLDDIEQQRESALGSDGAIQGRGGLLGSSFGSAQTNSINERYDSMISACQAQLDLNEIRLDRYNNCIENKNEITRKEIENIELDLQSKLNNLCFKEYGYGSKWTETLPARGYADGFGLKCTKSQDVLIEEIFSENFNKVMEGMPEYKDVVNRDVIKELSLLPQNAKKTFQQIVEETYKDKINYSILNISTTTTSSIIDSTINKSSYQIDKSFSNKLKGRIILQVESNGEGWYISPENSKRYFLGRPADAFNVMRELGLGISNRDFDSFKGVAPKRLSGRILLKVENSGESYYVNPVDFKMHFLGRPSDAFEVMRNLGLGISNNDINKIGIN